MRAPFVVLAAVGLALGLALSSADAVAADARDSRERDQCEGSPEGALCDDDNTCTVNDICRAGRCAGLRVPDGTECTDGNVCTQMDRCSAGVCAGQRAPDGTACDDQDLCSMGETCQAAVCVARAAVVCDDGVACTADICVPERGCVFAPQGDCSAARGPAPGGGGSGVTTGGGGAGNGPAAGGAAGDQGDAGLPDGPPSIGTAYEVEGGACFCALAGRGGRSEVAALPILLMMATLGFALQRPRR